MLEIKRKQKPLNERECWNDLYLKELCHTLKTIIMLPFTWLHRVWSRTDNLEVSKVDI